MILFPASIFAGVLVGYANGGRLRLLAQVRLRAGWVVGTAVAIQIALGALSRHQLLGAPFRVPLVLVSDLLVGAWVARNLATRSRSEQAALCTNGIGWLANLVPIAVYGAMPVSALALRQAGLSGLDVARGHLGKHMLATHSASVAAPWPALDDWIPLHVLAIVVSPGDLVMALGLAATVAAMMSPRWLRATAHPLPAAQVGAVAGR